jgi:hypothetical protein
MGFLKLGEIVVKIDFLHMRHFLNWDEFLCTQNICRYVSAHSAKIFPKTVIGVPDNFAVVPILE